MAKDAFKQTWADVLKRAKIDDLTFHDLRREAGSRFDEAGLTKAEHDLMMGHSTRSMTSLYITSDLKIIRQKLERYVLQGQTLQEAADDISKTGIPEEEVVRFRAAFQALKQGVSTAQIKAAGERAVRAWKAEGNIPTNVMIDVGTPDALYLRN